MVISLPFTLCGATKPRTNLKESSYSCSIPKAHSPYTYLNNHAFVAILLLVGHRVLQKERKKMSPVRPSFRIASQDPGVYGPHREDVFRIVKR